MHSGDGNDPYWFDAQYSMCSYEGMGVCPSVAASSPSGVVQAAPASVASGGAANTLNPGWVNALPEGVLVVNASNELLF